MSKNITIKIRRIFKYILSATIILTALFLIIGCVFIYSSGNGYSRDIVAVVFSKINIMVYLCLGLIIVDIVWELFSPSNTPKKNTTKKSNSNKANGFNLTNIIILVVAIGLIVFGAIWGGYLDVLTKAVNICTECIGLG